MIMTQDLEKEVERQFNIKYLDNKFDDLLKKVIKENLSDEKVYKNFDIEHKKIVIRIMSDKNGGRFRSTSLLKLVIMRCKKSYIMTPPLKTSKEK